MDLHLKSSGGPLFTVQQTAVSLSTHVQIFKVCAIRTRDVKSPLPVREAAKAYDRIILIDLEETQALCASA
jgi:hypothetical protein